VTRHHRRGGAQLAPSRRQMIHIIVMAGLDQIESGHDELVAVTAFG
jgi:hypothetical protein